MKPTRPRQFRPLAQDALEDRIAPSQITVGVPHAAAARRNPPAHVHAAGSTAKGAARATFPMNIADTIAAGSPVEEQRTTRFGGGSTQTETRLIQPDNANSSTLTTETINLRNNGGTETVSDFSYDSVMNSTVHVITTVLPDNSTQTENRTEQTQGNTTQFSARVKLPDGTFRAIGGTTVTNGPVRTTDETVAEPDGTVHHDHIVDVQRGELRQTETETVTNADGTRQVTRSTTTIVRVQPPSSASLGTTNGTVVSPPKLA